jgi:hypothetical protein
VEVTVLAREAAARVLVEGGREQLADALSSRDLRMESFEVHGAPRDAADGGSRDARTELGREGRDASDGHGRPDREGPPGDRRPPASDPGRLAFIQDSAARPGDGRHWVI